MHLYCIIFYVPRVCQFINTIIAKCYLTQYPSVQSLHASKAILFCGINKSQKNVIADIIHVSDAVLLDVILIGRILIFNYFIFIWREWGTCTINSLIFQDKITITLQGQVISNAQCSRNRAYKQFDSACSLVHMGSY